MKKWISLLLAVMMCLAAVPALAGWEVSGGRYWYSYEDGSWAANQWIKDGAWYYMDGAGWMVTGWRQIGGNWYYFDADGSMHTGWLDNGGGQLFFFDKNGIAYRGWKELDGKWK